MTIANILAKVDLGAISLPAFQRGYVWGRPQVRTFFDSLYRGHPVGSLLTWLTSRAGGSGGPTDLLLDGQQRVTSLYGVIRGKEPEFFSGQAKAFTNLYFHALEEQFAFYQPIKMKDDPLWFDVTEVMQVGVGGLEGLVTERLGRPGTGVDLGEIIKVQGRLQQLLAITGREIHIDQITDDIAPEAQRLDVVVDIFNRLNSAGTKLSQGDLALARIAAKWPDVRKEMRRLRTTWLGHGYKLSMDWLLRCVNAVAKGEADFQYLHDASRDEVEYGLERAAKHVNDCLTHISSFLGLDHDRVLFGRFAIPVMVRHMELHGPGFMGKEERDLLLYWFVQAGMRGRFSASTETAIKQDLAALDGTVDGIERLIGDIGTKWGRRLVTASDFNAWSIGARLYPVVYWLTRVGGARNFCDGMELKKGMLGAGAGLEVHHIFPKKVLYDAGYNRRDVNALANLCFLTAKCNKYIGAACPAGPSSRVKGKKDPVLRRIGRDGYFPYVEKENPGALESQWIPMDPELWKVDNFPEFLAARRELLADAANRHLAELYPKHADALPTSVTSRPVAADAAPSPTQADEDDILAQLGDWVAERGLTAGTLGYELRDPETQEIRATIDLAWPDGLQEGRGHPVALLLDESAETYRTVSKAGFDCFESTWAFQRFVVVEITGESGVGEDR